MHESFPASTYSENEIAWPRSRQAPCHIVATISWNAGVESLSQLAAMSAAVATELPQEHKRSYPENPCDLRSVNETKLSSFHTV